MRAATSILLLCLLPISAYSCTSAADCSLNGDCVAGNCACDPWWSGSSTCDVLAILPAKKSAPGYRNSSGVSSWGGMSIRDDAGVWHLFAAEMVGKCGLGSWKTNSRIVRGIGNLPGGPFTIEQAIMAPFAHNPKVFKTVDKSGATVYLIFSIGSGLWSTKPQSCDASVAVDIDSGDPAIHSSRAASAYPGPCGDGCGPESEGLNGGCGLSLGVAPTPAGPWSFSSINVTNQNQSSLLDCAHTNPSPWIAADGSIVMAINAGYCHGNLETIGLLQAPSYLGPWTYVSPDPILANADGSPHHCEDPFYWHDARGHHLMVHNQQGANVALYAHSEDARTWVMHDDAGNPGPYNGTIRWDDGTSDSFDVERPQFVFDPDSGRPLFLTNGAEGPTSFTLFRPLKQE